jgi:hypothetical protein
MVLGTGTGTVAIAVLDSRDYGALSWAPHTPLASFVSLHLRAYMDDHRHYTLIQLS